MAARDRIAPGLLASAVVVNYIVHKTGIADTICINGRRVLRTDTLAGRVVSVGLWAWFSGWFVPHFIKGPLQRG